MLKDAMDLVGMALHTYDPSNEHMHQVVLSLMSGARRTLLTSDEEARQSSTSLITGLAPLFARDKEEKVIEPHHKRWDEAIRAALSLVGCFFQHGDWGTSGRIFDTIIASAETLESTILYVETLGRRHKSHHPRTPRGSLLTFITKLEMMAGERNTEIANKLREAFLALPTSPRVLSEESRVEIQVQEVQHT